MLSRVNGAADAAIGKTNDAVKAPKIASPLVDIVLNIIKLLVLSNSKKISVCHCYSRIHILSINCAD